jgi:hypothetical protein
MLFGKLLPREGNFFEMFNHCQWQLQPASATDSLSDSDSERRAVFYYYLRRSPVQVGRLHYGPAFRRFYPQRPEPALVVLVVVPSTTLGITSSA